VGAKEDTVLEAAANLYQWGYLMQGAGDLRKRMRRIQCPPLELAPVARYVETACAALCNTPNILVSLPCKTPCKHAVVASPTTAVYLVPGTCHDAGAPCLPTQCFENKCTNQVTQCLHNSHLQAHWARRQPQHQQGRRQDKKKQRYRDSTQQGRGGGRRGRGGVAQVRKALLCILFMLLDPFYLQMYC
jgi:hypothetical protein